MDLYAENILDHSKHPRHKGELADATVQHEEKNLSCGDSVNVMLRINNGGIEEVSWTGSGCAISQAAMSMLSETLEGMKLSEAEKLQLDDIKTMLGVPIGTRRLKCALLCLHALKNDLHVLRNEPEQTWAETVGNE